MEPRGRAHVEVKIAMVNVMKSPEEGDHVIGPVPPPVGIIHEQKRGDASGPSGRSEPVQQANMLILCPHRHREWNWQHGKTDDGESGNRKHEIAHQTMQCAEMLASQRKTPLQPEQREKYTGYQRSANI